MSANPRIRCKACGGTCKRLIGTGAGIIFKGSGFYETDYKRQGPADGTNGAGGKAEPKAEPKSEKGGTKSESTSSKAD